jgi:nicotinic acid phosphoribosyltransferase
MPMTKSLNNLKPDLDVNKVDIYLPRGIKALRSAGVNPRGVFRIFQRHPGARFFGKEEYLRALMSIVRKLAPELSVEEIRDSIAVYSVPEGYALERHETAMILDGPGELLLPNETLLQYLSAGTRFRTLAADYSGKPWVFMGARYLSQEDLAICMRALSKEGILGTVPHYSSPVIGTESHSQETLAGAYRLSEKEESVIEKYSKNSEGLAVTIRATIAFAKANPGVPVYVLGDYVCRSIGCADTFIATIKACEELGIKVEGGRIDISKADLNDALIVDADLLKEAGRDLKNREASASRICGTRPAIVNLCRKKLDRAGFSRFKLIASSGIKLKQIDEFISAGADFVGIGEDAAYYLNKGECNYTSDCVGYYKKGMFYPLAKEGRELWRLALCWQAPLEKVDLEAYLSSPAK